MPLAGPESPVRDVLAQLGDGAKVVISSAEHPADRVHRQRVELIVLSFGLGVLGLLLLFAMGVVIWSTDPDVRRQGFSLLTAILGGALGFLAGRGMKT